MARRQGMGAREAKRLAPPASLLLRVLRENYRGGAWHGPSVLTALADLAVEGARWRPAPGRHTIWELAMHVAYARYLMLRRMGLGPSPFPHRLTKPWWPSSPAALTARAWADELALLDRLHGDLVAAVSGAGRRGLAVVRPGRSLTIGMEVLGLATHDAYHAGQMQLIRRLWEGRGRRSGR